MCWSFPVQPEPDPLVPAQGFNERKTRSRIIAIPAFLLHMLEFRSTEILMGAPIGCPNRQWSRVPKLQ